VPRAAAHQAAQRLWLRTSRSCPHNDGEETLWSHSRLPTHLRANDLLRSSDRIASSASPARVVSFSSRLLKVAGHAQTSSHPAVG
jgi:hypothetical protein